jgi:polysaccharide pyruvyl transferase WcaK-like protein
LPGPLFDMKLKLKKIALLHHTGCGNLGDDAIIDVVVNNIRERCGDAEITVFSMNPDDTVRRHAIPSLPIRTYRWEATAEPRQAKSNATGHRKLRNWLRSTRNPVIRLPRALAGEVTFLVESYRILKSFDCLIVSGGGQLTERGGPWSFPYALFVWGRLARWVRVEFLLLNVGAGPLNHRLSRFFILRALRMANYVSFRDPESQGLAAELGFSGKSYIFPDNAYSLEVVSSNAGTKRGDRPVVGVAPMPFPFSDMLKRPSDAQEIENRLVDKVAAFTSLLASDCYSIELFGSDTKADPPVIEDLRQTLRDRYHLSIPEYVPVTSVDELLSRMAAMDYVVTCRFHGVVFAHLLNKPVLAIAHHPKVTHLMNALGLSKYCVDMRTFDPARLMEAFKSLVEDTDAVKERLAASLADYRMQLETQWDALFAPEEYLPGLAPAIPAAGI